MPKETFYITTPIYYPSDRLHIGHAYCTTVADSLARYNRLIGKEVLFVTGSDEHGQKIQRRATEEGVTPKVYVDKIVSGFQELWARLDIKYDDFIRTTDDRHNEVVQEVFEKLFAQGDIYKGAYEGLYCTPCEAFWLERQAENGLCPDCGRAVEKVQEESYFLRLSKYSERLLEHIEKHADFIRPESRRNEVVNFIRQGLDDLCVSRTTFDWGIKVPFDDKHVVYVWVDALTNYITAAGYLADREKFNKFWPADVHLVGKEITRFHCIIWPIILIALGLPLPKTVFGHGWLVVEGDKMSKSKGNVIDPLALIDEFGADAIRYFLLREIQLGQDGNFSREALIKRINSDLANDLGNLLHRTLNMINKYNDGKIARPREMEPIDSELINMAAETADIYQMSMDKLDINLALKAVWQFISRTNKYIDETGPWTLAKDPNKRDRLLTVLYNLAEAVRIIAVFLKPIMPATAARIYAQLGIGAAIDHINLQDAKIWGELCGDIQIGTPEVLFPRIETDSDGTGETLPSKAKIKQRKEVAASGDNLAGCNAEIDIAEFAKIDLRIAKVIAAEKVPKADKLLLLKVDLGTEQRQVVAGIAQHYSPENLIGKEVLLVANLKPAIIRGIESRGMILAASTSDGILQLVAAPGMPAGARVK